MLEGTSYGLIAMGVILVAVFCFVWVEGKAALRANRSPSLADENEINLLRIARSTAVNRSRTESAGEEELLRFDLSLQMICAAQARLNGPDGNRLRHERGPEGVSHG